MANKKNMKHMRNVSEDLLVIEENGEKKAVYWEKSKVLDLVSLSEIKDQKEGECLLVASGPSVKEIDYNQVGEKPIFMMNGSISLAEQFEKNRIFYVVDDLGFIQRNMNIIITALDKAEVLFLCASGISYICEYDKMLLKGKKIVMIERVNRFYNVPQIKDKLFYKKNKNNPDFEFGGINFFNLNYNVGFTKNLLKGYFCGRTIPYCALQIAYHMGFRNISMIGADFTNIGQRFYCEASTEKTKLKEDYKRHIFPSFKIAKQCSVKDGWRLNILNSSSRLVKDGL